MLYEWILLLMHLFFCNAFNYWLTKIYLTEKKCLRVKILTKLTINLRETVLVLFWYRGGRAVFSQRRYFWPIPQLHASSGRNRGKISCWVGNCRLRDHVFSQWSIEERQTACSTKQRKWRPAKMLPAKLIRPYRCGHLFLVDYTREWFKEWSISVLAVQFL